MREYSAPINGYGLGPDIPNLRGLALKISRTGQPGDAAGRTHCSNDSLRHRFRRERTDQRDVSGLRGFPGRQREDRIPVKSRVDRVDRTRKTVVSHLGYLGHLHLAENDIRRDHPDRRRGA